MADKSCGTEADKFGSFITLAVLVLTIFPRLAKSSGCCWFSVRYSGKAEIILPAREISFVPILIPAALEKNRITGSSEALASCGASSTIVYNMSGLVISAIFLFPN